MTREEEINKAAENNTEIECGLKLKLEEDWEVRDITNAFIAGAKWADEHPINVWHNANEEPKRGSLILLIMQSGTAIVAKIIEPNHTFNHGERWAYINDLLPKE